jgi:hypothetical protein
MTKRIDLTPHASSTIDLMRFNGYSTISALADIIDNSLPALAKNISIRIEGDSLEDLTFIIKDDGIGMTHDELIEAMHLSTKDFKTERDKSDLGKFGFGLKSASFSQCKKLTVISKKNESIKNAMRWDLDFVKENNNWSIDHLPKEELDSFQAEKLIDDFEHGTVVVWTNCDRVLNQTMSKDDNQKYLADMIVELRMHLSLIYHKYLNKGLKISINDLEIEPMDPFCQKGNVGQRSTIQFQEEIIIDEKKITIKGYLLPHVTKLGGEKREKSISLNGDLLSNQGLYFYRVDRLISWGSWHGLLKKTEANKLARIDISIGNDLDYLWNIEIKKSSFSIPFVVKAKIRDLMKKVSQQSNRVGVRRLSQPGKENDFWKRILNKDTKSYSYEINKTNPIIEDIINNNNIEKDVAYQLLTLVEKTIPINFIKNDVAQNDYKYQNELKMDNELEESIIEQAHELKQLGLAFEKYASVVFVKMYPNIQEKESKIILMKIKDIWEGNE